MGEISRELNVWSKCYGTIQKKVNRAALLAAAAAAAAAATAAAASIEKKKKNSFLRFRSFSEKVFSAQIKQGLIEVHWRVCECVQTCANVRVRESIDTCASVCECVRACGTVCQCESACERG